MFKVIHSAACRAWRAPHASKREKLVKFVVYLRFGADSAESDIITNHMECDPPDWRGVARAIVNLY